MSHLDLALHYNSCTHLLGSAILFLTKILHRNFACDCKENFSSKLLIHFPQNLVGFPHTHTEHLCNVFCTVVNFFVHSVLSFLCFCPVSFYFVLQYRNICFVSISFFFHFLIWCTILYMMLKHS